MTAIGNPQPCTVRPPLRLYSLVNALRKELRGCRRVLEIGCGVDSPAQYLANDCELEGLDIHEPSLKACLKKGWLKKGHLAGAMDIDRIFSNKEFDACLALDLIEHLEKSEGELLLKKMEKISSKRLVVFTPNGFIPQSGDDNPWMEHKSGWTVADFESRSFRVVGINGWKALRGEYARLKYQPRLAWGLLSEMTQYLWTYRHAQAAFSLLAVKEV